MVSPASNIHQDLTSFLDTALRLFTEAHDLGEIRPAPFQMRLHEPPSGHEPDLIFVARQNVDRIRETYLDGPADMVVEIVSRESISRDRGDKFIEYEAGGVREYWLIDPDREQAEFYRLGADARYHTVIAGREGVFRSEVIPGFWIKLEWLWPRPLPKVREVLRELQVI